ncbi:putative membrane protein [Penicillium chrysogenum]|nr:putative membrane protein [Penicillium chrysogenum]
MENTSSRRKSDPTMSAEPLASTPGLEEIDVPFPPDDFTDNDEFGSPPASPGRLSRNGSFSNSSSYQEDWESFPPLDKLTIFDLLDNIQLSQRLEKWQQAIATQKDKVRKQREKLKSSSLNAKDRVMGEWKRRAPTADEKLEKYRSRMKQGVERLGKQWSKTVTVTLQEKVSFIAGVLNIFISGYLIGACPEYFYIWFSAQLAYFMPIRYYRYHAKGYHYFLADLCYFVNLLCMLSIWVFPNSKRLFISTFCLTFGNNAAAIAMWRNSMVFHSMDKVVSLFIHIMPPVTLHCIVHLTPVEKLKERFPAVYNIKFSQPGDPEHYGLGAMILLSTAPYVVWQLMYHFLITVRRRDKIAAGRPTSFTWLRKSYSKAWIGRFVLSLPEALQEPCFMFIQYGFALSTMIPCPIWFWYRWASGLYMAALFVWSIHNGATYYIDVFGKRFQKELEQLKTDVARWQSSPEGTTSPFLVPEPSPLSEAINAHNGDKRSSVDRIPLLDTAEASSTDVLEQSLNKDSLVRERT